MDAERSIQVEFVLKYFQYFQNFALEKNHNNFFPFSFAILISAVNEHLILLCNSMWGNKNKRMVLLWVVKWRNGVLLPSYILLYCFSSMGFPPHFHFSFLGWIMNQKCSLPDENVLGSDEVVLNLFFCKNIFAISFNSKKSPTDRVS